MGVIKGNVALNDAEQKAVTVTKTGQKVGLDVTINGAASEEAGINSLASGSVLYGLEWKGSTHDLAETLYDTITYYSDSAKTNLISTLVITYADATKADVAGVVRTDA